MPILPVIALITSWGISAIKNKYFKSVLLGMLFFLLLSQFCYLTFSSHRKRIGLSKFFRGTGFSDIKHKKDQYKINDVFDIIEKNRTTYKQTTMLTILLTGDNPNAFEMRYWARVKDRRYNLIDINVMCRSAYAEFDFIVFRLPSTSVSLLNNSILKPQNYMPIYLVKAQNTL